jgi:hypothetical protein
MKIFLLKTCKLGKADTVVDCTVDQGLSALAAKEARHPNVGELSNKNNMNADEARKALGMPSLAEEAAARKAAIAKAGRVVLPGEKVPPHAIAGRE